MNLHKLKYKDLIKVIKYLERQKLSNCCNDAIKDEDELTKAVNSDF